jgi:hypothetical protein
MEFLGTSQEVLRIPRQLLGVLREFLGKDDNCSIINKLVRIIIGNS